MTIVFPDWYEGGYPDRELVMCDLIQTYLNLCTPTGLACTWMPDNLSELIADGKPVVRLYRGGMGDDGLFDAAAVQLAVLTGRRADSWAVFEYLRQMLKTYERGGPVHRQDGSITQLASLEEIVGPQQLPDYNPDDRLVLANFRVECRLPQDLPDYALIREQLSL